MSRILPGLGLTGFWGNGFDGWDGGMDTNLRLLSAVVYGKVLDRVAAEPGAPTDGDIYLLTGTANVNKLAVRDNGAWVYITPWEGYTIWVADEDVQYRYDGAAWAALGSTTYTDEQARDAVGAALFAGVHTGIAVTLNDAGDAINLDLITEYLQDLIGAMLSGNVETGIVVTYDDTAGKFDFTTVGAQPYIVGTFFDLAPASSEILLDTIFAVAANFGVNWSGAVGHVVVNPTASFVMDIQKALGGAAFANVGTITVSTGGVFTFATSANFAVGDRLRIKAPVVADATVAGMSVSLIGTR